MFSVYIPDAKFRVGRSKEDTAEGGISGISEIDEVAFMIAPAESNIEIHGPSGGSELNRQPQGSDMESVAYFQRRFEHRFRQPRRKTDATVIVVQVKGV